MADGFLLEFFGSGEGFGGLFLVSTKDMRNMQSATLTNFRQASLCGSGMLASTLLISLAPKPVAVLLCLGLVKLGPTGPARSASGELMDGRRSRAGAGVVAILSMSMGAIRYLSKVRQCRIGDTGGKEDAVRLVQRNYLGKELERSVAANCGFKKFVTRGEGQVFSLFQGGKP